MSAVRYRRALLICGILSSFLYIAMDVIIGMEWEGYSPFSRTISELSAVDAPTRPLWVVPGAIYSVLFVAFAWGVWTSAGRNHRVRRVGGLLLAYAALGVAWPFAPMHGREALAAGGATWQDTLHLVLAAITVVLTFLTIGFGAVTFGKRFRIYSIASMLVLAGFGVLTFLEAPRLQANLPTPWIGLWERINFGVFLLWVVVLATTLLRVRDVHTSGIAERGYWRIGGIDQWVMIRGENVANPILVLLHGGPGMTEMPMFRCFNARLEQSFTVVYWDQRGAGKSFHPGIEKSSMTVEQFIADLDQLVDVVRARLGQSKVVIFGHSWGSTLGVLYAARFPEKVSAYVGGAQIGDCAASESASYAFTVAEAQRLDNHKALEALRAIGPPPYSASSVFTERTWSQRLDGQLRPAALWNMARIALGGPESVLLNLRRTIRGFRFTMNAMWPEVSTLNLPKRVPTLRMPVFFFLGRRDHWVPPETSVEYFNALTAPDKTLVWFEQSGHEMFADEPDKFNRTMMELVRPTARGEVRAVA
jgi:pimeloyl-ACP methyl ester carboxylesterase